MQLFLLDICLIKVGRTYKPDYHFFLKGAGGGSTVRKLEQNIVTGEHLEMVLIS